MMLRRAIGLRVGEDGSARKKIINECLAPASRHAVSHA
jgi:hypothetical protein